MNSKREEFLSYDNWKKQSPNQIENLLNKQNSNIGSTPQNRRISLEKNNIFYSPIRGPDDKLFVELVLKYVLVKKQGIFPENRVKYLQNELFSLENQEQSKHHNEKMQYLALNFINNGEELFREILDNKTNHNLTRIQVRKFFLQKLSFLGMLEKGYSYKIEENLWEIFKYLANEMLLSKTHL